MGLYPDLLPGYHSPTGHSEFHTDWGEVPQAAGLDLVAMIDRAKAGHLGAVYVVGSNPVGRLRIAPFALSKAFAVVQDMLLTETAIMAHVVLPPAHAYLQSGTFTNTSGGVQLLTRARERALTK